MRKSWLLSCALAGFIAFGHHNAAVAIPAAPNALSSVASMSNIELARARGAAVRGPRGGVAVRGRYGGVAVRGPRGGVAVRGAYRVGGRYYGGTWYGARRRYWRGRWWAYGVGSCWRSTPIGYVWICG